MSEKIKGYVVRGVGKSSARTFWAEVIDRVNPIALVESRERAMEYPTLGEAIGALSQMGSCRDVTILAVAEDGTETPLPSYEQALAIVGHARRLIRSSNCKVTTGPPANLARIDCDDEPYSALFALFEAEAEAARIIPDLVCAECSGYIYRGSEYAGPTGNTAHKDCCTWPKGTTFRRAGESTGASS